MQLCKERVDFSALVAEQRDNDARREMSFHAGGTTPIPGWKQNSLGVEPQKMTVALSLTRGEAMRVCVLTPHATAVLNEQRVSETAAALFTPYLPLAHQLLK